MLCPRCGHRNLSGVDQCGRCLTDLTALDRRGPLDAIGQSLMTDTVATLQRHAPAVVSLGASVAQALQVLLDEEVGAVLIVDDSGLLAGIFTERDLLNKVAGLETSLGEIPVDQFMTARPGTVTADDTLAFALHKMDVGGYRHLPVIANGKPIGILSVRDVIRHMPKLC
jgi:CBS domain-containing protein